MLYIREVKEEDSEQILTWRNNPEIFKYLLTPKPVDRTEHISWFKSILDNKTVKFFVAFLGEDPCGTIRFDMLGNFKEAEVGIYIDPKFFGKGIGLNLLKLGEEEIKKTFDLKKIQARVLNENIASKKMFLKNNYELKQLILEKEF